MGRLWRRAYSCFFTADRQYACLPLNSLLQCFVFDSKIIKISLISVLRCQAGIRQEALFIVPSFACSMIVSIHRKWLTVSITSSTLRGRNIWRPFHPAKYLTMFWETAFSYRCVLIFLNFHTLNNIAFAFPHDIYKLKRCSSDIISENR